MTFKQALALQAHVRKGEHGAMVVFADRFTKKETDADGNDVEREIPVPEGLRGCSTSRRSKACRLTTTLSPRPRPRSCSRSRAPRSSSPDRKSTRLNSSH